MAKRRPLLGVLSIGCAMLVASPSWAVVIEPGLGDLSINRGLGFKAITSRVNAKVGDSVMVGPGGAATVTYDDGCKINVQPGAVTTIAPLSPCASGSNAAVTNQSWWQCGDPAHPEDNHDCGTTTAFGVVYAGWLAFIIYEITHTHGPTFTPAGTPASD